MRDRDKACHLLQTREEERWGHRTAASWLWDCGASGTLALFLPVDGFTALPRGRPPGMLGNSVSPLIFVHLFLLVSQIRRKRSLSQSL